MLYQLEMVMEPVGDLTWSGIVRYGLSAYQPISEFDTSGSTARVTHSLATVHSYPAGGGTAPNHHGAINVTDRGVEGVDVTVPQLKRAETRYLTDATVTAAYIATLSGLTGCVNNATYYGFAAGELKFMGAAGRRRGFDLWEVTFFFEALPNATGLVVGGVSGIEKRGWDYLWVQSRPAADDAAKAPTSEVVAVYVEQVSNYADFTVLGL